MGRWRRTIDAKAKLFAGVGAPAPRVAVINADDPWGSERLRHDVTSATLMAYGLNPDRAEYVAQNVMLHAGQTSVSMEDPSADDRNRSPLTGRVNIYNLLAASVCRVGAWIDAA